MFISCLTWVFVLASAAIRTEATTVRVTCILQPAYNAEEFAEGENEEEEIQGWGPGSPSQGQSSGASSSLESHQLPVTESEESGSSEERVSHVTSGSSRASGSGSPSRGSLTDPSKPPGNNPSWGYWEWDNERGRWEMEDYKRRRRRRQVNGRTLSGKLQCGAGNLIHVTSVTKGFSINNQCQPVRDGCDEPSTLTSCTGRSDSCGVTVAQSYMQRCSRWTNYVRIQYECIPAEERHNICEAKTFSSKGSLVISSPSYGGSPVDAQQNFLSCECELSRASNAALSIPYLHLHLQATPDVCSEDMLLIDTWDASANRFALKEELCGVTSRRNLTYSTDLIKLTYIPSAIRHANGFLLRMEGKPNRHADLQVKCSTTAADKGPSAGAGEQSAAALPPPFSGVENKTLTEWKERINSEGGTAGQISSRRTGASGSGTGTGQVGDEEFNVTGKSGVLSAVVASLSSIILILSTVGVYLWYRRGKRRNEKCSVSFCVRSSRSDGDWMSDTPYQDPVGPWSSIPTSPPASVSSSTPQTEGSSLDKVVLTSKPSSQPELGLPSGAVPPDLPARPPACKKKLHRRLAEEEDVQYDNPTGCDVTVMEDTDYTSIQDIADALSPQDVGTGYDV